MPGDAPGSAGPARSPDADEKDAVRKPIAGDPATADPGPPDSVVQPLLRRQTPPAVPLPTGTVLGSVITITNTLLGAGMLAMPSAIASLGLFPGVFMLLFSGACSGFGLYLLAESARRAGPRGASFFALSRITYPAAAGFFDAAIAVKCFGVSVSYLVIAGDLLPEIADAVVGHTLPPDSVWRSKTLWILASTPLVVPTVMLRKLDSLRHTSTAALLAVLYLLLLVVLMFAQLNGGVPSKDIDFFFSPELGVFRAIKSLPVFIFAFTCHQNIFSVYNELSDNAPRFVNLVILAAISTAISTYLVLGITGYLTFGRTVGSNLIGQYPSDRAPVVIGQLCFALLVLFSFPLQAHPARTSIDKVLTVLFPPAAPASALPTPAGTPPIAAPAAAAQRMPQARFVGISVSLLVASYSTAILAAGNLGSVLSIVGATGSVTIQYILPGLFYWKVTEGEDDHPGGGTDDEAEPLAGEGTGKPAAAFARAGAATRRMALGLACYGFAVMLLALGVRLL